MKKTRVFYRFILFLFLVMLLGIFFSHREACAQTTDTGYWKLVKVENTGQQAAVIADRFKTREFYKGSSRSGHVEGAKTAYFDEKKDTLVSEASGFVKWSPPPAQAKPGAKWDGGFTGGIIKDFNMHAQHGYGNRIILEIDVSAEAIDSPSCNRTGYYNQNIGFYVTNDTKKTPPAKSTVFEFPEKGKLKGTMGGNYIVLHVDARLSMGGSDTYNYIYEWVPARKRDIRGHLQIVARNNHGGVIEGLEFEVKNLETGDKETMTTEKNGVARKEFFAGNVTALRIQIMNAEIKPSTRYHIALEGVSPSRVYEHTKVQIPVNKTIIMDEKPNVYTTFNYQLNLFRLLIVCTKWDDKKLEWYDCPAHVSIRDGRKQLVLIPKDVFKTQGNRVNTEVYLPTRELLKINNVDVFGFDPADKFSDLQTFTIPSMKDINKLHMVRLQLSDLGQKISKIRYKLLQYFMPIVGEEKAKLIANVKFSFDPKHGSISYLDGVIRIPGSIDLTKDIWCETLMHEWTHHIMAVLSPDPAIEGLLGGAHDVWTRSPNKELAWDEARAHFFAVLLTRGINIPYDPDSFSPKQAKPYMGKHADGGDFIEGIAAAALVNYYSTAGYKKSSDVVSNFLEVDQFAQKNLGHPIRTSGQFFEVMKTMIDKKKGEKTITEAQAEKEHKLIELITKRYGITVK